jgi:hypothetical protein
MPLIPAQHVEERDTLSLRLDHGVYERLERYAEFIESPKRYVIVQALERLFRSDKEFTRWLAACANPMPIRGDTLNDVRDPETPSRSTTDRARTRAGSGSTPDGAR